VEHYRFRDDVLRLLHLLAEPPAANCGYFNDRGRVRGCFLRHKRSVVDLYTVCRFGIVFTEDNISL
jgi:hypothetical protein